MSWPLQRAVTDFAADVSFAQAVDKVVEHYGVLLSESSIRRTMQWHAEQMYREFIPLSQWPEAPGQKVVIGEMDGSMIPITQADTSQSDRRKGKVLSWREAKLSLVHAKGSQDVAYGGTVQGGVEAAGRVDEVIQVLERHMEADDIVDQEAPIRCCHRYLRHRRGQLDYPRALEKELPIGSGEIESAHRHVIQQRLKRPGVWWRIDNAEHMLSLRLNRANRQWSAYWAKEMKQAA